MILENLRRIQLCHLMNNTTFAKKFSIVMAFFRSYRFLYLLIAFYIGFNVQQFDTAEFCQVFGNLPEFSGNSTKGQDRLYCDSEMIVEVFCHDIQVPIAAYKNIETPLYKPNYTYKLRPNKTIYLEHLGPPPRV